MCAAIALAVPVIIISEIETRKAKKQLKKLKDGKL